MTDDEWTAEFHRLVTQGPSAAKQINELLRGEEGGISRLSRVIPKPKARRSPAPPSGTFLPDDFPDEHAKANAMAHWRKHGREDLCEMLDRIIDDFRNYHAAGNTRAISWPRTWATWYCNQVHMQPQRPRADLFSQGAAVVFEQTSVEGWVKRLEVYYDPNRAEGCPAVWSDRWGPAPGRPDCKVPPDATAAYEARYARRQA